MVFGGGERLQIFTVNRPKVIYQKFQNEVILINLELGSYYSLEGSGAETWALLESGADRQAIMDQFTAQYRATAEEIAGGVNRFLDDLLAEGLVSPIDGQPVAIHRNGHIAAGERPQFVPPTFTKYTDMEDLLVLDPIHDVDETGWPAQNRP
jgi:hypothetical protein